MEDIQLITYIIFAVLYLVFKFMQKKKDPTQNPDEAAQQPRKPQRPAKSFEEMLREFSGENLEEEKIEEEEKPARKPVTSKPEKSPEPSKYFSYETEYDQQAQKTYKESVERGQKAMTLDEQVDLDNLKIRKIQVIDEEENERSVAQDYLEAFKTQEGAKKALIYSEIFNRKYF